VSGWRRCPRCGSGAVVERTSGCLGCLVLIGIIFTMMCAFGAVTSGGFVKDPVSSILGFIFLTLVIVFFIFLFIKFGHSLYCKSCKLHFKPNKK